MKKGFVLFVLLWTVLTGCWAEGRDVKDVRWDKYGLMVGGRRVCPVMGEIHYSRVAADEWDRELAKMKEGGVTMVATYVFWNHIEEVEGVFRWDGQRCLRAFLEACRRQDMPVVLRIGPFCHGEVRNGGIPDWMFTKGCRLRSQDSLFMACVERLYRQIFTQVQGLQWKDGGPVLGCQMDNEYRGSGDYLMALKRMAQGVGFDVPLYTRTGWPELSKPVPFGEMLPLYGDYADGFWEKDTGEAVGTYYKAFNFRQSPLPATTLGEVSNGNVNDHGFNGFNGLTGGNGNLGYPYFTCELGGGMATAYHRRPYIYAKDTYAMALVKLGSGSNLLGYYMYHGGTNPEGVVTRLNECQTSPGTANNDMPVCTYDFQAPLGEFGQRRESYYLLRPLHLFMHDYGEQLAEMEPSFPCEQERDKGDDSSLRWAVREKNGSGFIFVSNYERLQTLTDKRDVRLKACGVTLPPLTIPAGTMAILPVNVEGIRWATGQLVAKRDGRVYMMQLKGVPTTIVLQNGKTLRNVKARGTAKPVWGQLYLLTEEQAQHLFMSNDACEPMKEKAVEVVKVSDAGPLRPIVKGRAKVAEAPSETDWQQAAVYRMSLPPADERKDCLLVIDYVGDCARLYGGGRLLDDNFYNGRPFEYGVWRLPADCTELELRILPLQPQAPIYLPREARTDATAPLVKARFVMK